MIKHLAVTPEGRCEVIDGPLPQRGLFWILYVEDDGIRRIAAYVPSNRLLWAVDTRVNFVTSLPELIEEYWPDAVEFAQERALPAADGVPWEIHLIEDQAAHESALAAYKAAKP